MADLPNRTVVAVTAPGASSPPGVTLSEVVQGAGHPLLHETFRARSRCRYEPPYPVPDGDYPGRTGLQAGALNVGCRYSRSLHVLVDETRSFTGGVQIF